MKAYVRDGFLPAEVLGRAGRRETDDRLPAIVAAIKGADPEITLQAICDRLESIARTDPSRSCQLAAVFGQNVARTSGAAWPNFIRIGSLPTVTSSGSNS